MSSVETVVTAGDRPQSAGSSADEGPHRGRRRRWVGPGLIVILAASLMALLFYGVASHGQGSGIDDQLARGQSAPAPGFRGTILARGTLSGPLSTRLMPGVLAGHLDDAGLRGTPYALNFWASWCPPCAAESSALSAAWPEARSRGVAIIGLDSLDNSADARRFMADHHVDYPSVHDATNLVAGRWKVPGFPETFFVTAGGRIVGHIIGPVTAEQLSRGIDDAVRGHPAPAAQGAGRSTPAATQ